MVIWKILCSKLIPVNFPTNFYSFSQDPFSVEKKEKGNGRLSEFFLGLDFGEALLGGISKQKETSLIMSSSKPSGLIWQYNEGS